MHNLWEIDLEWLRQQFELSRGGDAKNLRPMEGLRGFAVFLVFLVHYVTLISPWLRTHSYIYEVARSLHAIGNLGVDLFFVLSGYLIYGSLISKPQRFLKFMLRRIQRLYPAFIIVLIVYIALSFLFPSENKIPSQNIAGAIYIIQNLLLLPGLLPIEPILTVAWSLSYEMFFYLAIPSVINIFNLRNWKPLWRIVLFLLLALLIIGYCTVNGGHIRMAMFISGIILFECFVNSSFPVPSTLVALLLMMTVFLNKIYPLGGNIGNAISIAIQFSAFFALCFNCFRNSQSWLSCIFSWAQLRWLGNISYSYYLLHGLALKAFFFILPSVLPVTAYGSWLFWSLLPIMFIWTLFPAIMLFLFIERPFSLVKIK